MAPAGITVPGLLLGVGLGGFADASPTPDPPVAPHAHQHRRAPRERGRRPRGHALANGCSRRLPGTLAGLDCSARDARRPPRSRPATAPAQPRRQPLHGSAIRPARQWPTRARYVVATARRLLARAPRAADRSSGRKTAQPRRVAMRAHRSAPLHGASRSAYAGQPELVISAAGPPSSRRAGGQLDRCPSWDIRRGVVPSRSSRLITNSARVLPHRRRSGRDGTMGWSR